MNDDLGIDSVAQGRGAKRDSQEKVWMTAPTAVQGIGAPTFFPHAILSTLQAFHVTRFANACHDAA